MSDLLNELRGLGLVMGTRYEPTSFTDPETNEDHFSQLHVGHTADQAKADKARDKGRDGDELRRVFPELGNHGAGDRSVSADPYDAVQDARRETRSEWNDGDVADDAAEAFRWGFTADGREPEECGREQ